MYEYRKLSVDEQLATCAERTAKGQPRHSPPHLYDHRGWFLITAATYEHDSYFTSSADRSWLLDELRSTLNQQDIVLAAWVVLPNHYHLLLKISRLHPLSDLLRKVHARTSRELNWRDAVSGRQIWYRYSDRAIRSERHYHTTLNYLHHNPVKHGYASSPYDWEASSVHWYLEQWGNDALDRLWNDYPLISYGKGWDD